MPTKEGQVDPDERLAFVAGDDDRRLVAALRLGDEAAFVAVLDRHHTAMIRLAARYVPNEAVAEEVVQETWLAVLRGLRAFEGRASLKTWIFRILANRARSRATREARVVPFAELASAEDEQSDADLERRFSADGQWTDPPTDWRVHSPEALVLRQEVMQHLATALEALPPAQRTVVTLRDVDGWSSEEVCESLEISEGNQRVLLHRARTRLRAALAASLGQR